MSTIRGAARHARTHLAAHDTGRPVVQRSLQVALAMSIVLGVVSVCTTASVAAPAAADDLFDAKLNTRSLGTKWMCIAHRRYPIVPDSNGYAALPAGVRVTIGADDGRDAARFGAQQCIRSTSFVPKAGQSYFMGFESDGGRCTAFVYREVTTNRMGLGLEPTLGPADDCVHG